jgi:hypothetical protein
MAADQNVLSEFCEKAIGPACVDFAARIGAEEPMPANTGSQFGYKIHLPHAFRQAGEKSVLVCAEPFDDEAFSVKASRPDTPGQLRQIAIVRYDAIKGDAMAKESTRIRAKIGESLESLREAMSNRTT